MAIYYHLDRCRLLTPGLIIQLEPHLVDDHAAGFSSGVSRFGRNTFLNTEQAEAAVKREAILESIREQFYPECPSRYTSFFGFISVEDVHRFQGQFQFDGPVWMVEAAEGFKADVNLFWQQESNWAACAHLYWGQKHGMPPHLFEYLLKPPITVVEQVASLLPPRSLGT